MWGVYPLNSTIVLSDLHLCKRLSSIGDIAELRPLWQGFDELILNGDTEESYSKRYATRSQDGRRTLVKLAEDDGLRVHLLNGNHDPMISNAHAYTLFEDKVLIMHGHAVFREVAPWTWYAPQIVAHRDELLIEFGDCYESQLRATQLASERSAKSRAVINRPRFIALPFKMAWCVAKILQTWKRFPVITEKWLATYAPKTKIVVVGHTHHAGIWNVHGRVIINTGCFGFPSHPRAVIIKNNTLKVVRIRKNNNMYYLAQELGSWQLDAL
jgi:exonuclease SbcD